MKDWLSPGNAAVAMAIFMGIGVGFVIFGFATMYNVDTIIQGDAYNYIIAATRGTALIGIGIASLVVGSACAVVLVLNMVFQPQRQNGIRNPDDLRVQSHTSESSLDIEESKEEATMHRYGITFENGAYYHDYYRFEQLNDAIDFVRRRQSK